MSFIVGENMYYGENVFVSHCSIKPIHSQNCTFVFGKFLYTIQAFDELIFFDRFLEKDCLVQGVIKGKYGYTGSIYKEMTSQECSDVLSTISKDIYCNNISNDYDIIYPKEEKYGVLVLKGKIDFDLRTVWAKKKFELIHGDAAFETSMQEWLTPGSSYYYLNESEKTIELIGTAIKDIKCWRKIDAYK